MTTPAPGDMTAWSEIACQRGCTAHATRGVTVDLAKRHGYADYAAVPQRLALQFRMEIWDTDRHLSPGAYCPANDAVSETIVSTGIWDPPATCLVLDIARPGARMLDFGCQIGWFSLLAAHAGMVVDAYDADTANLAALRHSRGGLPIFTHHARVGVDELAIPAVPYRFVKIDLEGAEADAVDALAGLLLAGQVEHLLIEISPVFRPGDHYPDLVERLIGYGFEAHVVPEKAVPPRPFDNAEQYLAASRIDTLGPERLRALVNSWDQRDCWFKHRDASW